MHRPKPERSDWELYKRFLIVGWSRACFAPLMFMLAFGDGVELGCLWRGRLAGLHTLGCKRMKIAGDRGF